MGDEFDRMVERLAQHEAQSQAPIDWGKVVVIAFFVIVVFVVVPLLGGQ